MDRTLLNILTLAACISIVMLGIAAIFHVIGG